MNDKLDKSQQTESNKHAGLSNISTDSEDVADYYDDWANDYDSTLSNWQYVAPQQVASKLSEKLSSESSILDVGSGTGLSGKALQDAGFGTVDGIDVSSRSLEIAKTTKAYRNLTAMNLQDLPLNIPAGEYDGIACVGVLTYLTDGAGTLKEFCRIVKPDGFVTMTQRTDLFAERDFRRTCESLVTDGLAKKLNISEPCPYLPDNEEFGDQILIHYISFVVA